MITFYIIMISTTTAWLILTIYFYTKDTDDGNICLFAGGLILGVVGWAFVGLTFNSKVEYKLDGFKYEVVETFTKTIIFNEENELTLTTIKQLNEFKKGGAIVLRKTWNLYGVQDNTSLRLYSSSKVKKLKKEQKEKDPRKKILIKKTPPDSLKVKK